MESLSPRLPPACGGRDAGSTEPPYARGVPSPAQVAGDLTSLEFRILVTLADHGPCPIAGITGSLGAHAAHVNRACERLRGEYLAVRQDRSTARAERQDWLALTDAGWELLDEIITEELRLEARR